MSAASGQLQTCLSNLNVEGSVTATGVITPSLIVGTAGEGVGGISQWSGSNLYVDFLSKTGGGGISAGDITSYAYNASAGSAGTFRMCKWSLGGLGPSAVNPSISFYVPLVVDGPLQVNGPLTTGPLTTTASGTVELGTNGNFNLVSNFAPIPIPAGYHYAAGVTKITLTNIGYVYPVTGALGNSGWPPAELVFTGGVAYAVVPRFPNPLPIDNNVPAVQYVIFNLVAN